MDLKRPRDSTSNWIGTMNLLQFNLERICFVIVIMYHIDNSVGFLYSFLGMDYVQRNHNKPAVASMSLGGGASSTLDQAVRSLVNNGITVVVAAGNENENACYSSPAREPKVLINYTITVFLFDPDPNKCFIRIN